MSHQDNITLDGKIINVSAGIFLVEVGEGHIVTATLGGRLRKNKIRVVLGDQVKVNVSPYDPSRGFISFRCK